MLIELRQARSCASMLHNKQEDKQQGQRVQLPHQISNQLSTSLHLATALLPYLPSHTNFGVSKSCSTVKLFANLPSWAGNDFLGDTSAVYLLQYILCQFAPCWYNIAQAVRQKPIARCGTTSVIIRGVPSADLGRQIGHGPAGPSNNKENETKKENREKVHSLYNHDLTSDKNVTDWTSSSSSTLRSPHQHYDVEDNITTSDALGSRRHSSHHGHATTPHSRSSGTSARNRLPCQRDRTPRRPWPAPPHVPTQLAEPMQPDYRRHYQQHYYH